VFATTSTQKKKAILNLVTVSKNISSLKKNKKGKG
jgi:hypothetical protein